MPQPLWNGRYRVERKLGEGGMGEVWLVSDTLLGDRPLAYKLLKARATHLDFFKHEFKVLTQLDHPNVVLVHDFGLAEGGCYYTCEYLEGQDLLAATEGIDWDDLSGIVRGVLEALAYVHDRGLVHYDVKPTNVNVTRRPPALPGERAELRVKLMDFGLAAEARARGEGQVRGTVHYMAPEVAKGRASDRRADLYSLGVTLYQVITRKLPHDGRSAFSVIRKHLTRIPEPPGKLRPDVPESWTRFVLRLLEKEPADRFPSAGAALEELARMTGRAAGAGAALEGAAPRVFSPRFVGRRSELELLASALPDASRRADAPAVVLLEGEGGSGKTRLLDELEVLAQLRGIPFVRAACGGFGAEMGASPFEAVLREVLLLESRTGSAPGPLAALALEYRDDLDALFPGIAGDVPAGASRPREQRDRRLLSDRVAGFLVRAARAHPFALAVEDAHAASPASIPTDVLVEAIARNLEGETGAPPALLLVIASLPPRHPESGRWVRARRIALGPLSPGEVSALAASMLALEAPDEALGRALHAATAGNPFHVEELVRALVEEGALMPRRGLAPGAELLETRSLAELVEKRVSALAPDARSVLQALAVLALPSTLAVLAPASGLSPELSVRASGASEATRSLQQGASAASDRSVASVLDALDALEKRELVARSRAAVADGAGERDADEGPRFSVAHAPVLRAALRDLAPESERALHERVAFAIEGHARGAERRAAAPRLARHFARAGLDAKALAFHREAGEQAVLAHRNEDAHASFERALELAERLPGEDTADLREKLGDALATLGMYEHAERVLGELVASPGQDAGSAVRARRRLGEVALRRGDYARATEWLRAALELARASSPSSGTGRGELRRERARALQALAQVELWRGEYPSAIELAQEALDTWRALRAGPESLPSLNVLSSAEYYRGRYTPAARLLRESLELSRRCASSWRALLGDLGVGGEADRVFGEALASLDAQPGAVRRGAGDSFGLVLSFSELGTYFDLCADAATNVRYHEASLAAYERMSDAQGTALSLNNLGVYLRMQGLHARALASLERALAIHEAAKDGQGAAVALQNIAMLLLALGDAEGAERQASRALSRAVELGVSWMAGHARRVLGKTAALRGDREGETRELAGAEEVFLRLGNPRSLGDVLLDRAESALERGEVDAARELVERAHGTGDEAKGEDFLARARLVVGRSWIASDARRALDELEAGLGYAEPLGVAELRIDAHRALAEAHEKHGTLRLAARHAERAREIEGRVATGLPLELREKLDRSVGVVRARSLAERVAGSLRRESGR